MIRSLSLLQSESKLPTFLQYLIFADIEFIVLALVIFLTYFKDIVLIRLGKYRIRAIDPFVYTIEVEKKLLWFIPIYSPVGYCRKDDMFGFEDFITYKFNSIEDAEKYYWSSLA